MASAHIPNPPPPPPNPSIDEEARRRRQVEEDQALAEAKATGRGSTIVAGGAIARDAQAARSTARRARAASSDLL